MVVFVFVAVIVATIPVMVSVFSQVNSDACPSKVTQFTKPQESSKSPGKDATMAQSNEI